MNLLCFISNPLFRGAPGTKFAVKLFVFYVTTTVAVLLVIRLHVVLPGKARRRRAWRSVVDFPEETFSYCSRLGMLSRA